jgi:hypothetical protein
MNEPHIGDILVFKGVPESNNPYKGSSLMGEERKSALTAFKHKEKTECYTFWFAPSCGGAKQVLSPDEINWSTSGIK